MLQELPLKFSSILLQIFNKLLHSSSIPPAWNNYISIPILKPGKSPSTPSSFRPIALASCIRKTFERILKPRLEYYLETNSIIPSHQFGFRKGRSTSSSITSLWSKLKLNLAKKLFSIVTFFDIKAAFDCASINILINELSLIGIPPSFLKLIYNLFAISNVRVSSQDFLSDNIQAITGLRQGTILAPLLFIFLVNKVGSSLPPHSFITSYADDFVIVSTAPSLYEAQARAQISSNIILNDLNLLGFEISVEKSKALIISKNPSTPTSFPQIRLNNTPIPYVPEAKFLGFILTSNLSPSSHLNGVISKVQKRINILRAISGIWWGADPNSMILLYKSLIRPIIDYVSFIYNDAPKNSLLKINRLQWKSIRISIGAMCSTHTRSLEVESNIMPLESRRQLLADRFILSLYKCNDNDALTSLNSLNSFLSSRDSHNKYLIIKRLRSLNNFNIISSPSHPYFKFPFNVPFFPIKVHYFYNFVNNKVPKSPSLIFNSIILASTYPILH